MHVDVVIGHRARGGLLHGHPIRGMVVMIVHSVQVRGSNETTDTSIRVVVAIRSTVAMTAVQRIVIVAPEVQVTVLRRSQGVRREGDRGGHDETGR